MKTRLAQCEPLPINGRGGFFRCRYCGWENKNPAAKAPRRNCGKAPRLSVYPEGYRTPEEIDRLVDVFCRPCASFPYTMLDAASGRYRVVEMCGEQRGCKRVQTAEQWRARLIDSRWRCPLGRWVERVDVLYAVNGNNAQWVESMAGPPLAVLAAGGLSALKWDAYGQPVEELRQVLRRTRPRLVVNAAMFIRPHILEVLAGDFPQTRFVTSCHSSQSDLARNPAWLIRQFEFLGVVRRHSNCYYALVDERPELLEALGCPRVVHLSNCAAPPPDLSDRPKLHLPPVVSLICEARTLKNLPNQLMGAALVARRRRLRVLLSVRGDEQELAYKYAAGLGLDVDVRAWATWSDYRAMIARDVDVGLQASFTETFNFVSLDHMQAGRPVIGSPAIRFLPRPWQANPDDPADLARRLVRVIDHYTHASQLAIFTAARKTKTVNEAFLTTVRDLMSAI